MYTYVLKAIATFLNLLSQKAIAITKSEYLPNSYGYVIGICLPYTGMNKRTITYNHCI